MDRNSNSHFSAAPQASIERSTFRRPFNNKTSFQVGQLIPFYLDEVLPGDTVKIETSKVMRLQTLITPVMDNLYLDTYYFFVPNRLVWKHWKNFAGESEKAWAPAVDYVVPKLVMEASGTGLGQRTLWDFFGLPVGSKAHGLRVNALPFRMYSKIVDDWFRDENLIDPLFIPDGDSDETFYFSGTPTAPGNDFYRGGWPFIAAKYHDYFTSCLPSPQKGDAVQLLNDMNLPVVTSDDFIDFDYPVPSLSFDMADGTGSLAEGIKAVGIYTPQSGSNHFVGTDGDITTATNAEPIVPSNLFAKFDNVNYAGLNVNDLRRAFAVQRMLEKDARGGSRYIELILSHFGVESPDARMQRSEYLGGNRSPLNIEQITQTSSTDSTSPLGSQAGYSVTGDVSFDVNKSFTEHGFIIGLMCARYDHTYQQGVERMWSRNTRYDYYWPVFAHLGEQAVLNKEIYAHPSTGHDEDVFGYQEAWAEYRYKPNLVTSMMRSEFPQSLDIWHFADFYDTMPRLSEDWIREDRHNIDRTLAIPSNTASQIFGDIMVNATWTRPMPLYSIPGMIDHF